MLDSTKKYAPHALGDVLILGLGTTGKALATYCASLVGSRINSLTLAPGAFSEESQAFIDSLTPAPAVLFDTEEFSDTYHLCIASPGISQFSAFYQNAQKQSLEIISEVEFAWRESSANSVWIAITGTNGKTTTTALSAFLLQSVGKRARAVGNIGDTCIEAVASGDIDYYVAEVSSYQLASTFRFDPQVSVLLNITPDHLSWHTSFDKYCQAKCKIFQNAHASSTVILDATNEIVRGYYKTLRQRFDDINNQAIVPLGTQDGIASSMITRCHAPCAAYVDEGSLVVERFGRRVVLARLQDLALKGEHNALNALAAACAALSVCEASEYGVLGKALCEFQPLEHRIEPCGSVAGIQCYNDSKATNVDATLKALAAFGDEKPFVLLGGKDKGTDLTSLVSAACAHTKGVICFGQAGPRFKQAFQNANIPVFSGQHLADSFEAALDYLQPGDILLLSPACASFDEFTSFEQRGNVFKELVHKYAQERGV